MAGKVSDHDWVYLSERLEQSKPRARTLAARGRSKVPFASGFGEHFSPLISMTENLSEWVEPYDRELLTKNLKECLGYQGLNVNGFHLLTLSPRPFLEMRTNYQLPLYVVSMVRLSVLEHFLRWVGVKGIALSLGARFRGREKEDEKSASEARRAVVLARRYISFFPTAEPGTSLQPCPNVS